MPHSPEGTIGYWINTPGATPGAFLFPQGNQVRGTTHQYNVLLFPPPIASTWTKCPHYCEFSDEGYRPLVDESSEGLGGLLTCCHVVDVLTWSTRSTPVEKSVKK